MNQAPDAPLPEPDEIVALLLAVLGRIRDGLDRQAQELDLPPRQAMALLHLDAPISMRQLAVCMRCDASNVTSLADRLELRGLVERSAIPADRRVTHLVLTEQGRLVRDRLRAQLYAADCALAALDGLQQAHLAELLARMLAGRGDPGGSLA